ncbi:hypothetical protein [Candidatus Spongiihabitans sp.]|uniref:hypothetical protein n=1 Tax=Candidatus Spongiihabitans sp. TaxID=3101308 RepID=UPI003C7B9157
MMDNLSNREQSLLQDVAENDDRRLLFFQKVKGLKWFDALYEEGYFSPKDNPKPVSVEGTDYVNIPYWPITDYLVKTATELPAQEYDKYAKKFVQILVGVTEYAKKHEYSNYRTWWKFSRILENIPPQILREKDLDIIDYWLKDRNGSDLIAEQIGMKWLVGLLKSDNKHSLRLSKKILDILYQVMITKGNNFETSSKNASFRFDKYYAEKITNEVAKISGEKLGEGAIFIFDEQLKYVLKKLNNDTWSSLWHPAIEDHEQNKYRNETKNMLVQGYRDSLDGFIEINVEKAGEHIKEMLNGEYQTIHRLAIHSISNNYTGFKNFTDELLTDVFFSSNFRHEMWHFLHKNYEEFSSKQKNQILKIIGDISINDGDNVYHKEATAYNKVCWLDAIKSFGGKENNLYEENLQIAKTGEPDHPDFSSYMSSVEWVKRESPFSIDELGGLLIGDLIEKLNNYENLDIWSEPSVDGLRAMFNQLIKREPRKFYLELDRCADLDLPYINEIIRAYSDLWEEKTDLPWDDVWNKLLKFFEDMIHKPGFWDDENNQQSDSSVYDRRQIVSGISKIVKSGAYPGDSALSVVPIEDAKKIILHLLSKEKGGKFKEGENAVVIAINNPRGQCLEALINLASRSCRLADKENNDNHSATWKNFCSHFDAELDRADAEKPEYEFITLVTNWLPHFLYMSEEWVLSNLDRIFDQSRDLKWACAMQGHAYVRTLGPKVYQRLASHGDLIKALDTENIIGLVKEKVIEHIVISFLDDMDNETNLMNILIERNKYEEIYRLIWEIRTARNKSKANMQKKVFELFPKILTKIDFSTDDGKKTASQLCIWAEFIDSIDGEQKKWLLDIAKYAKCDHKDHELLKNLSRLSERQPFESQEIWLTMLDEYLYPYPEDAIREFFKNLINNGKDGERKAKEVVGKYLKLELTQPQEWLEEVRAGNND